MTDDIWQPLTSPTPTGARPRPHRHRYTVDGLMEITLDGTPVCQSCGQERSRTASRRGRTNRARGNAIEREVAHRLGLRRVGQFGGPEDAASELFVAQVKSGGSFSERYWSWLRAIPANAAQTPLLVVTDAPGPGHKRRALVVLDMDSWLELHGPEVPE